MWTSIENSTDPAEFGVYLNKYPDGQYAELARIRRDRLGKKPDAQQAAVTKQQPSMSGAGAIINPVSQAAGQSGPSTDNDDAKAALCRQFAGGDPQTFAECMDEYQDEGGWMPDDDLPAFGDFAAGAMPPQQAGQSSIWYDNEFNQWQVSINGDNFSATAFIPGFGQIVIRGQSQGYATSYGIFDAAGQQFGYAFHK